MIDRDRIEQLIHLLKGSSSVELAVREGDSYIRVRRGPEAAVGMVGEVGGAGAARISAEALPAAASDDAIVRARLVGRFFRGKAPGQPPLVNVGDHVEEGETIGTIDALGKLTGIPCPEEGDVVELLAEEGAPVHYGAPLVRIRRRRG